MLDLITERNRCNNSAGIEVSKIAFTYVDGETDFYSLSDIDGIYLGDNIVKINNNEYRDITIRVSADKYLRKSEDDFEIWESIDGMAGCACNDMSLVTFIYSNESGDGCYILTNNKCLDAGKPELCLRGNYECDENNEQTGIYEIKAYASQRNY